MANTHKINGEKWRLSGVGWETWEGGSVWKHGEVIAHQSDDYRVGGKN